MYKAIFMDLDGTVLNSKGEITENTKNVLLDAQNKGIYVVLNSGRVSSSTIFFARQIGLKGYVISGNGAVITDIDTEEVIYINCMEKNLAFKIIDICEENSIYYNLYTLKDVYTKKLEYSTLFYNVENRKIEENKRVKINICPNVKKTVQESENMLIAKFTICDKHKSIFDSIMRKLKTIEGTSVLDVSHSSRKLILVGTKEVEINYYYTEVSKYNANKWTAIEFLINKLGINQKEIVAFGDNANDIEMIKNAGLGIVVNNAAKIYKEQADYITNSNNEEGVANAIRKFCLMN